MTPQRLPGILVLCCLVIGFTDPVSAQSGGYWPQFRGPDRSNVVRETGLLKEWPTDGPPLLWKITDLGTGLSPISLAEGRIYTLAYRNKTEFVVALDKGTAKEIWTTAVGQAREMPVMTFLRQRQPVVDGERLYAFTCDGELLCLEVDAGQVLWKKNYKVDFGGKSSYWGWSDNPLVDGDRLICSPGAKDGTLMALNKKTGDMIWKTATPEGDLPSYSPVVVAEVGGMRQYVQFLSKGLVGVAAGDGKVLWRYNKTSSGTANAPTPIVRGDHIFAAGGFGTGSALLKLVPADGTIKVEEVYFTKKFQNAHGGMVLVGDHVYGGNSGGFHDGAPTCLELKTGNIAWKTRGPSSKSFCVVAADGHLYCRHNDGLVTLLEATPSGYKERGKFMPPDRQGGAWTMPVIAGGRLYLRDHKTLLCYDLRENPPAPLAPDKPTSQEPAKKDRVPDAVFVPSPQDVVEKMLELASVKKESLVVDLGCGDGRIVIAAATKYGCKAIGYDLDEDCVKLAVDNVKKNKVEDLVRIVHEDIFKVDLSQADVAMLYLLPRLNVKLIPQLDKMKPGARIVSHAFDMQGVTPDQVIAYTSKEDGLERKLYLWTVPLKKEKRAGDWAMWGRAPDRNHVSPEKNPPMDWQTDKIDRNNVVVARDRNIKWSAELGSSTLGEPIVSGGLLFIGTNNEKPRDPRHKEDASVLMCFRESDGKFLWQYLSPRLRNVQQDEDWPKLGMGSSPLVEGDRLWLLTNRCETICLDIGPLRRGDGEPKLLWKVDMRKEFDVLSRSSPMGMSFSSSIAGHKDWIYVVTGNGPSLDGKIPAPPEAPSLVCFHKETGKVIWKDSSPGKNILGSQRSSPLVQEIGGRAQVIVGQGDGWLRSFDAAGGQLLWKCDLNRKDAKFAQLGRGNRNYVVATPVHADGRIYIATGQDYADAGVGPGCLYCIDPTGEGDISLELEDGPGKGKPNPKSGVLWHTPQGTISEEEAKKLGRANCDYAFGRTGCSCVVKEGFLYTADLDGYFYCFDANTGRVYWSHDFKAEALATPLWVDGKVYAGTGDGDVWIFAHGKEKKEPRQIDMERYISAAPIFANGVLYINTHQKLYAIGERK